MPTRAWFCTWSLSFTATRLWRPTSRPCRPDGALRPSSVATVMSTFASVPSGLNSTSHCSAPRTVVPAAKYHAREVTLAHALTASWSAASMPDSTATEGEKVSTTSPPGTPSAARAVTDTEAGATSIVCWTGADRSSGQIVRSTRAGSSPMFAIEIVSRSPATEGGAPGQNHARAPVPVVAIAAASSSVGAGADVALSRLPTRIATSKSASSATMIGNCRVVLMRAPPPCARACDATRRAPRSTARARTTARRAGAGSRRRRRRRHPPS